MPFKIAFLLLTAQALAVPDGYELSDWAEPFDIEYPTALTAAADGTVYVSVDRNGSIGKAKSMGKIISCRDTNGDGKADQFVDFVPDVDSPRGGHFVRDTLYLIHPPFLSAFRDTTGDGVADEQKVLLENIGFGLRHPRGSDHTTNGCRMGIDGWIYIAVGDFGMEGTVGTDGKVVTLRGGGVARVRPDGSDLQVYSYHTRNICDVAISPTLDMFARDNTNDGKGWNIRVHHLTEGSEHGYPRLYKNFAEESVKPMLDLGGGSGTGALYLNEPGHEEMLLTCDWTTGKIYRDDLSPNGASFTVQESVFMDLPRAVDIDVDGSSNLYLADWRGGRFRFGGEGVKVGMIQKLTKKGFQAEPWEDLTKLKLEQLLRKLAGPSAVARLEVQREILSRKDDPSFHAAAVEGLVKMLGPDHQKIEIKVAALMTLEQMDWASPEDMIEVLSIPEDELMRFALRSAGDRGGEASKGALVILYRDLESSDLRQQMQAMIALSKLTVPTAEATQKILNAVKQSNDERIQHTAMNCLVTMADVPTLLAHSQSETARRALMRLHLPEVVAGLVSQLEKSPEGVSLDLTRVLARLYHRSQKWDRKEWWGTRPDDRGPYFAFETWSETPRIQAALETSFLKANDAQKKEMMHIFGLNRLPVSRLNLGEQDPVSLALISTAPNAQEIQLLVGAAVDAKRAWPRRLECFRALAKVPNGGNIKPQLNVLGQWLNEKVKPEDVEREVIDFTNQPDLINYRPPIREVAAKADAQTSRVAWRTLLTQARSPLAKERHRVAIEKILAEMPREEGLFLALADLLLPGYDAQIENAIESDNDSLIEAAKHAKKVIAEAKAGKGKTLSEMKSPQVMKHAMKGIGNALAGKSLYLSQGCIACHAVDQKAVQKGPYLGSAGSKFTKDYLIESILEPNAVVAQGFQTELISMKDGMVHMGFVTREEDGALDVRNIGGVVTTLKVDEIAKRDHQKQSMMPAGLASSLTLEQFNDLIAYLVSLKE